MTQPIRRKLSSAAVEISSTPVQTWALYTVLADLCLGNSVELKLPGNPTTRKLPDGKEYVRWRMGGIQTNTIHPFTLAISHMEKPDPGDSTKRQVVGPIRVGIQNEVSVASSYRIQPPGEPSDDAALAQVVVAGIVVELWAHGRGSVQVREQLLQAGHEGELPDDSESMADIGHDQRLNALNIATAGARAHMRHVTGPQRQPNVAAAISDIESHARRDAHGNVVAALTSLALLCSCDPERAIVLPLQRLLLSPNVPNPPSPPQTT